jgi:hypothetical protein
MSDQDQLSASPFYALLEAGRMECPTCGRMLLWNPKYPRAKGRSTKANDRDWNPISSTILCPKCGTRYQLGIIAWPLRPQQPTPIAIPPGQRATLRQLAEIRQRSGGFWSRTYRKVEEPINRYVPEGCTCAPLPWRRECTVHGGLTLEQREREE